MLTFVLAAVAIAHVRRGLAVRTPRAAPPRAGHRARHPGPGGDRRDHRAHRPEPVDRVPPPALLAGDHRRWRCCSCSRLDHPRPTAPRGPAVAPRLARRSPPPGSCSTSAPWSPAPARTPATPTPTRNGLDPLQVSQLHADAGLPARRPHGRAAARAARRRRGPARHAGGRRAARRRARARALIGFVQYFTDLPDRARRLPHARRGPDLRGRRPGR